MADFLFNAVPHDEAVDFIASKPVVSKTVFDRLLPELRARAFTISGIDAANAVQDIRDRIAELPAGATWDAVKKDIARKISVHFIDPAADRDERDKQVNASNRRAELLLRTHGFQAYQTASFSRMTEQKDVLPYWQYITMGDGRVRPAHAALNGVVLPADSPFWNAHFPPWDFGCRCQCVPLSKEDHAEIQAADAKLPAEKQRVLEGPLLRELELNNRLVRGPNDIANVSPPSGPGAYHWHPGNRDLTVADLRSRYDNTTFGDFEAWARKTTVRPGETVWHWIGGTSAPPSPKKPGGPPAVVPPKPAVPLPAAKPLPPASVVELLARVGLDQTTTATPQAMAALQKALVKDSPVQSGAVFKSISIDQPALYKQITPARLGEVAQGFLDFLPPATANTLPPFEMVVKETLPNDSLGTYDENSKVLSLSGGSLDGSPGALKKTAWHEMVHWLHDHGPVEHRERIAVLFATRTNNFTDKKAKLKPFNRADITGFDDDFLDAWGDEYAGRVYPWETGKPFGYEIVTRHLEKLALSPPLLADHWNFQSPKTGRYAWREAFIECLHLLFPVPPAPAQIP